MTGRITTSLVIFACCGLSCAPTSAPPEAHRGPDRHSTSASEPAEKVEPLSFAPHRIDPTVRARVEQAIENVRRRSLLTTNAFWTVFHGILGLGPSTMLHDPQTGVQVNALEHICTGGRLRGLQFIPTRHGLDVFMGEIGLAQGHQDQFIAEMMQWGISPDRTFVVQNQTYSFRDFILHCQKRARTTANQELSWAVIVIAQYFGTNASWTNEHGERLTVEDLVRYELDAPIETAACGGTHRLFGLTWVYHLHLKNGGQRTGVWAEVAAKTAAYREKAKNSRNADGSLSTGFFAEPGNAADRTLRINTTGHIFEWLALAASDQELAETWMEEAANALSLMILEARDEPIDTGSLYHAVHGLIIYYARRYDRKWLGPLDPPVPLLPS